MARKERASDKEAQVSTFFVRDLGTYEMSQVPVLPNPVA